VSESCSTQQADNSCPHPNKCLERHENCFAGDQLAGWSLRLRQRERALRVSTRLRVLLVTFTQWIIFVGAFTPLIAQLAWETAKAVWAKLN
jgi:hypothetical protein